LTNTKLFGSHQILGWLRQWVESSAIIIVFDGNHVL